MEREHGGRQTTARPRHFMTHGHRVSAWNLGRLPLQPLIKLDQAGPLVMLFGKEALHFSIAAVSAASCLVPPSRQTSSDCKTNLKTILT